MKWQPNEILSALDQCCDAYTFPVLDNSYVYLAATRLALYRSVDDWAMTIEVFGFSPRSGLPDTQVYTFGSRLLRQKKAEDFVNPAAYATYLAKNPNNEATFIYPIEAGDWQDPQNEELLDIGHQTIHIRGFPLPTWSQQEYIAHGISLQEAPRIHVFEYCRMLAATNRERVLATTDERRKCVPPELEQILQLEDWNHPDLASGECASANATFVSLANVLANGSASNYKPLNPPNTHWTYWPDAGTL